MIEIQNLKKRYGATTATDIEQLTISDGELLALVGNNGAGKTTLFRLMLDLAKPDSGSVALMGIRPDQSEQWKQFTAAWLDEAFLIDFLTPEEYFLFIARITNVSPADANSRLAQCQALFNGEVMGRQKLIRQLSAGNRQKVGIAAAMLPQPKILLLDEPFNFLDPTSQTQLKRLLTLYHQQTRATIIVSSHNLSHTLDIATHTALMENGKIMKHLQNNTNTKKILLEYFEK